MKVKSSKGSSDDFIILAAETPAEEKKLKDWHNSVVSAQHFPRLLPAKKQGTLLLCREI